MKSLKFFGKPKKLPKILLFRRVAGDSMTPALRSGTVVWATAICRPRPEDVIIIKHDNIEKIKRVRDITKDALYVTGDNPSRSTDSRTLGWLPLSVIEAVVIWPRLSRK